VSHACRKVGIERSTAYRARERSPEFAEAWDDAYATGTDRLRDEALKRAVYGTERQVFDGDGKLIRREINPSDFLLNAEIGRRMPRESIAVDLRVQVIDHFRQAMRQLDALPPERLVALAVKPLDARRAFAALPARTDATEAETVPVPAANDPGPGVTR
jgi:hypothetical protein